MGTYAWQGVATNGRSVQGKMEAPSKLVVYNSLKTKGIVPKGNKIKAEDSLIQHKLKIPSLSSKIKSRDIVLFTRQFATMIDAGLPIINGLDVLGHQNEKPNMKTVLFGIKEHVSTGSTLASAMSHYPKAFDNLMVNMVAAGEAGGILDTILERLADYLEKMDILRRQVKTAMIYPAVVISAAIIVTSVLLIYVIPTFADLFRDYGAALPAPTRFVISLSEFMVSYGSYLAVALALFIWLYRCFMKTDQGKEMMHPIYLKIPIFGQIIRKVAVSRLTRTLGTLLTAGVPIIDALKICGKTSGNKVVEKEIDDVRMSITEGKTIAEPLAKSEIFPPMVVQMIAVGESTGALDAMLHKVADFYDDEVNNAVSGMKQLIEPLMIMILGTLVGGLVVAMYLPIFKLGSVIG